MTVETATVVYSIAVGFAFFAALSVPLAYQWFSHGEWRRHADGRHLFGSDMMFVILLASYFICALLNQPVWERIGLAVLMVIFGMYRLSRVRFMRRWTQHDGYDNREHPRTYPNQRENADDLQ